MFDDIILKFILFRLGKIVIGPASIGEVCPGSTSNRISMREEDGILGALLVIR